MAKKIQNATKKKAWDEFSRWVRVHDCLESTGLPFVGVCITCDRRFHIRYLQAGHCLPGRTNAKLFNEKLVHAQCKWCNEFKHGEKDKYEKKMIGRYGEKEFEQMKIKAKQIIHNSEMDFEKLAEDYKSKYKDLIRPHGYATWPQLMGWQ